MNKEKYISFDPTAVHISLIRAINEISGSQDRGQQAPLQLAIAFIVNLDDDEAKEVLKRAAQERIQIRPDVGELPKTVKIKVDETLCQKVEELFRSAFNGLIRIQRPYFVRVILTAYYCHLREEGLKLGVSEKPIPTSVENEKDVEEGINNLLRFKVSVDVADMMLHNVLEDDVYIKQIFEIMRRRGERH